MGNINSWMAILLYLTSLEVSGILFSLQSLLLLACSSDSPPSYLMGWSSFFCFLSLASTPNMWKQGGFLPRSWVFPGDFIPTHSIEKMPFLQWLCMPAVSLQTHPGHHMSASDRLSPPSHPRGLILPCQWVHHWVEIGTSTPHCK